MKDLERKLKDMIRNKENYKESEEQKINRMKRNLARLTVRAEFECQDSSEQRKLEASLAHENDILRNIDHELSEFHARLELLNINSNSLSLQIQTLLRKSAYLYDLSKELQNGLRINKMFSEGGPSRNDTVEDSVFSPADLVELMAPKVVQNSNFIGTLASNQTSKTVLGLLPKYETSTDIRGYTQRIKHTWNFIKMEGFDEKKFCNLVRLGVSSTLGEILDNWLSKTGPDQVTVDNMIEEILLKLDQRPSEYISELKTVRKLPNESYSVFAHRLTELFKKGISGNQISQGAKRLLIEQFFHGIGESEAMTLRLVANDEELKDISKLAIRAARLGKTSK